MVSTDGVKQRYAKEFIENELPDIDTIFSLTIIRNRLRSFAKRKGGKCDCIKLQDLESCVLIFFNLPRQHDVQDEADFEVMQRLSDLFMNKRYL